MNLHLAFREKAKPLKPSTVGTIVSTPTGHSDKFDLLLEKMPGSTRRSVVNIKNRYSPIKSCLQSEVKRIALFDVVRSRDPKLAPSILTHGGYHSCKIVGTSDFEGQSDHKV